MKISSVIGMLQALQQMHGDQDLVVADEGDHWFGITTNVQMREAGSLELIPVIVIQGERVA